VSFEMTFEGVKWCWSSDSSRYMIPDLWSSRGESTFSQRQLVVCPILQQIMVETVLIGNWRQHPLLEWKQRC